MSSLINLLNSPYDLTIEDFNNRSAEVSSRSESECFNLYIPRNYQNAGFLLASQLFSFKQAFLKTEVLIKYINPFANFTNDKILNLNKSQILDVKITELDYVSDSEYLNQAFNYSLNIIYSHMASKNYHKEISSETKKQLKLLSAKTTSASEWELLLDLLIKYPITHKHLIDESNVLNHFNEIINFSVQEIRESRSLVPLLNISPIFSYIWSRQIFIDWNL